MKYLKHINEDLNDVEDILDFFRDNEVDIDDIEGEESVSTIPLDSALKAIVNYCGVDEDKAKRILDNNTSEIIEDIDSNSDY